MSCDRKLGPFDCCSVVQGDCLELMKLLPDGCVDAVITDPPYPSYYTKEFRYHDGLIFGLKLFSCRQFVFWTPSTPFPLSWGGKRIWDKAVGTCTQFEEIYERNHASGYFIHKHYSMGCFSSVSAQMTGEEITGHPSQKPLALLTELINETDAETILDPFLGSGTTAVAAKKLGRHFLGFEISEEYCRIARERIALVEMQPNLFDKKPEQLSCFHPPGPEGKGTGEGECPE